MNNKVEKRIFLGVYVRVINGEYVVLKDMFTALRRVRADGSWTDSRRKLEKIIGKDNIHSVKIPCENISKHRKTTQNNSVLCAKIRELEKYDIVNIFSKKSNVVYVNYRQEYSAIEKIKDCFKHWTLSKIKTQVPVLEYRIDCMIGEGVYIEFDECHHKKQQYDDIKRMKEIGSYIAFGNRNDCRAYINNTYNEEDYSIFETSGGVFVRLRNENNMSWISYLLNTFNKSLRGENLEVVV